MKRKNLALCAMIAAALGGQALANDVAPSDAGTATKLVLDQQGRVLVAQMPDGRVCSYSYGPNGVVIRVSDPACGDPTQWLPAPPAK